MGRKKGQLFFVAIVFMIGLIFIIQHALFQYTSMDMSEPFENTDYHLVRDTINSINTTLIETQNCNETKDNFAERMEEFKLLLERSNFRGIYGISVIYDLKCDNWKNTPPEPAPLDLTVSVTGMGKETSGNFEMYHELE